MDFVTKYNEKWQPISLRDIIAEEIVGIKNEF